MKIGPIVLPTIKATNPIKTLAVKMTHARQTIMFGGSFPTALQSDIVEFNIPVPIMGVDAAASRAIVGQLLELAENADWQRAGIYITMREDVNDVQDGWYGIGSVSAPEDMPAEKGWLEADMDVLLRCRRTSSIGVFVDAKVQVNDLNLGGVATGIYPAGLGNGYPQATYAMVGVDGSTINLVESPPATMRAPIVSPTDIMSLGRCAVTDEI